MKKLLCLLLALDLLVVAYDVRRGWYVPSSTRDSARDTQNPYATKDFGCIKTHDDATHDLVGTPTSQKPDST